MYLLSIITGFFLLLSFVKDKGKTGKAFKIAWKKFTNIAPAFFVMLSFVAITLALVPDSMIAGLLGKENIWTAMLMAAATGSITFMPGFIAYPLCGILREQHVPFMVLSAFTTTLMMVGILTFPVEKSYLGTKVTVIRNIIGFITAIIIALFTGLIFGEIV